jgi:hypothetical protein
MCSAQWTPSTTAQTIIVVQKTPNMCTRNGSGRTRHTLWSYIKCQKISYLTPRKCEMQSMSRNSVTAQQVLLQMKLSLPVSLKKWLCRRHYRSRPCQTAMVGMRRVGLPQQLAALQESPGTSTSRSWCYCTNYCLWGSKLTCCLNWNWAPSGILQNKEIWICFRQVAQWGSWSRETESTNTSAHNISVS